MAKIKLCFSFLRGWLNGAAAQLDNYLSLLFGAKFYLKFLLINCLLCSSKQTLLQRVPEGASSTTTVQSSGLRQALQRAEVRPVLHF